MCWFNLCGCDSKITLIGVNLWQYDHKYIFSLKQMLKECPSPQSVNVTTKTVRLKKCENLRYIDDYPYQKNNLKK